MTKLRTLALLVVAGHWLVAMWHLFLAAKILVGPNNNVSWLAVILISSLHLVAATAIWKLSYGFIGWISLVFFLAALGADLYEHFLIRGPNNVFMVAPGDWTAWFDASVFVLLGLEILGCLLGILSLGSRVRTSKSTLRLDSNVSKPGPGFPSSWFTPVC